MPFFDYLAQHPEDASVFSEAMLGFMEENLQRSRPPTTFLCSRQSSMLEGHLAICSPLYLGNTQSLEACCSIGRTLWSMLKSRSKRTVFTDRVTVEGWRFFLSVPSGGDAYILFAYLARLER